MAFFSSLVLLATIFFCLLSPGHALGERSSPCIFDPMNPIGPFRLLDPSDGMPFLNVNGSLRKSDRAIDKFPEYNFLPRPEIEEKLHDIQLDSAYLAIFDTGRLAFVSESSNGLDAVDRDGESFITTAFSISCEGTISLRLPENLKANFAYHAPSRGIFARPEVSAPRFRYSHSFLKRKNEEFKFIDSWEPFNFLAGPSKISDFYQIGGGPRCPKHPFGLESFVKPGARPAFFNGCGAENGMKVPDLQFTDCCNEHDLCYDDCYMRWEDCNNNFRNCMKEACVKNYRHLPANASDPAVNSTTWSEWGCKNLADTYAGFVDTGLGAWAFSNSNYDRCDCACPTGTMNCTDICLRDCNERCDVLDCSTPTSVGGWWWSAASPASPLAQPAPSATSSKLSSSTLATSIKSATSASTPTAKPAVTIVPPTDDTASWWWPSWGNEFSVGSMFKFSSKSPGTTTRNKVTTYWWWPFK